MQSLPDGRVIPKGTVVTFHPWCMGRDPDVYPDPLTVRPERWIPFEVIRVGREVMRSLKYADNNSVSASAS